LFLLAKLLNNRFHTLILPSHTISKETPTHNSVSIFGLSVQGRTALCKSTQAEEMICLQKGALPLLQIRTWRTQRLQEAAHTVLQEKTESQAGECTSSCRHCRYQEETQGAFAEKEAGVGD
jgi:hypothetical protein